MNDPLLPTGKPAVSIEESRLRVHRIIPSSRAEGPGSRFVIWVQGCSRGCPGCAVPWTWPEEGGSWYDIDALAEQVLDVPEIEGITFLGGEPFEQAAPLARLGKRLRESGLSVLTFTGYEFAELRAADRDDWNALIAVSDILIDGPFVESVASTERPWVGSSNQRFYFLTSRYAENILATPNRIEIRLQPDGSVALNGLASGEVWNRLVAKLRAE